ncbi:permease-like cell division protein FtsX [Actinophytocola sp.]|uniref:permease-like cell division protein FtsX n=1 Tax=Actinophytocola sp. TaxID=1872138 RepID=UPI002ED80F89
MEDTPPEPADSPAPTGSTEPPARPAEPAAASAEPRAGSPEPAAGSAEPAARSRRPIIWLVTAAAVLVVAGVVTTVLLSGRETVGTPVAAWPEDTAAPPQMPVPSAGVSDEMIRKACRDRHGRETLVIFFGVTDSDANMRLAAEVVREDPRVGSVATETQQEAYVRFKETFADRPDLIDVVRPEALPASVTVLPVAGTSVDELHTALQAKDIQGVDQFQLGCDMPGR